MSTHTMPVNPLDLVPCPQCSMRKPWCLVCEGDGKISRLAASLVQLKLSVTGIGGPPEAAAIPIDRGSQLHKDIVNGKVSGLSATLFQNEPPEALKKEGREAKPEEIWLRSP